MMSKYLTIATFIDHVGWYTVKVFGVRIRISKLLSCPCLVSAIFFKFHLSNLNVWMSYIAQLAKLSQEFCCYIKTFYCQWSSSLEGIYCY